MINYFEFLAYIGITSGNCESNGYAFIEDYTECEIAAKSFDYGISRTYKDKVNWHPDGYQYGCFQYSYLNVNSAFVVNGGYSDDPNTYQNCTTTKQCICKEE